MKHFRIRRHPFSKPHLGKKLRHNVGVLPKHSAGVKIFPAEQNFCCRALNLPDHLLSGQTLVRILIAAITGPKRATRASTLAQHSQRAHRYFISLTPEQLKAGGGTGSSLESILAHLRVHTGAQKSAGGGEAWMERKARRNETTAQDANWRAQTSRDSLHSSAPGAPTLPLLSGGKQSRLLGTLDWPWP